MDRHQSRRPNQRTVPQARQLRLQATMAERLLWPRLRNSRLCGLKFRRQHPFAGYVLDYFCAEARLVVELDGDSHGTEEAQAADAQRTATLRDAGLRVIRFWNHQVFEDLDWVVGRILEAAGGDPQQRDAADSEGF